MIEITNVEKAFQDTKVLKGVSLKIDDKQIFGIIGQSGAGKSTLLRCINGLEPFDAGTIKVDGVSVGDLSKKEMRLLQRQMGMIFQDFNLLERLDVFDNIALPMKFWGIDPKAEVNTRQIMNLIHLVGLDEKVHAKPRELSGGQKQRVAIARAIVLDPKILLCDEATSALDPEITKDILALLQKINREMGITIVVVTHQMEVIRQICEHVVFLGDGRVLAEGMPERLFVQPPNKEIAGFVRERSDNLPEHGVNIRLFFLGDTQPIVTRMARELDCDFGICWAKIEDFRDNAAGSIVINLEDEYVERAERYMTDNGISWEVVS
jgi:D-methionine transport system ATP-binding protein